MGVFKHKALTCLVLFFALFLTTGCLDESFKATDSSQDLNNTGGDSGNNPVDPPGDGSSTGGDSNNNGGGGSTTGQGVAAFVAVGHMQSAMYSCDGGETWKGYVTQDPAVRCWDETSPNNVECDHTAFSSTGLAYGEDGFIATYGWGYPGDTVKTVNGSQWSVLNNEPQVKAGVSYGNGVYLLNDRTVELSSDGGQTWQTGASIDFTPWNVRQTAFVNQGAGFFISSASTGENNTEFQISRDNGLSFSEPANRPATCGNGLVAHNDTTVVILSDDICVSNDEGVSWQVVQNPPDARYGGLIYGAGSFKIYDSNVVYISVDGFNWTETPLTTTPGSSLGQGIGRSVAYHPSLNKFVAISQRWARYYEHTEYLHSVDGVEWTQLDKSNAEVPQTPHPIRHIRAGFIDDCQ